MAFEDLISPEQVLAAKGYGEVPPRPCGAPTVGLTTARHVVFLSGLTRAKWLKDPVEQVSASGWTRWYPMEPADYNEVIAREEAERNSRKGRRKTKGPMFDGDVNPPEEPRRNGHPWN